MATRRSTLTGSWSGAYRYPGGALPETVFNAQIEERDGAFTGATQEPNMFGRVPNVTVLSADIEGVRTDRSIVFTKFYGESAGVDFAIRYQGDADETLTRIDGVWINRDWSGSFFMVRDDDGAAAEAEERAEATVGRPNDAER